jgi:uncharacterized protein YndB with AHSA1/START domain
MTDPTIRKSVYLKADPQTVWDHLTRADLLGKWFHPATADLSAGEDFTLTDGPGGDRMCWGRVEEMKPTHYMRWSFTVGPLNGAMTTVEWHVEPAIGGTRLSLEHAGLPADAEGFGLVLALDKGWHGFLLNLHEL